MNFNPITILIICFFTLFSCKDGKNEPTATISADTTVSSENNQNQPENFPTATNTGVYFLGGGGEPSWSVEFTDGKIHFNAPNETLRSFVAPIPEPEKNGNTTKYIAKSHRVIMEVLITEEECIDGMSGKKKSDKVKLSIKPIAEKDYKIYEGCGTYGNK